MNKPNRKECYNKDKDNPIQRQFVLQKIIFQVNKFCKP